MVSITELKLRLVRVDKTFYVIYIYFLLPIYTNNEV